MTKICSICGCSKSASEYDKHDSAKDGLRSYCIVCRRSKRKENYAENKDKILAKQKEAYKNNSEKKKEYQRKYRLENIEIVRVKDRAYVEKNKEVLRQKKRDYYLKNKERLIQYQANLYETDKEKMKERMRNNYVSNKAGYLYRAAKRRCELKFRAVPWADAESIKNIYRIAKRMSEVTGIEHVVDHCYPIMGKFVSGLHVEGNLKVVANDYNASKHNNIPEYLTL